MTNLTLPLHVMSFSHSECVDTGICHMIVSSHSNAVHYNHQDQDGESLSSISWRVWSSPSNLLSV